MGFDENIFKALHKRFKKINQPRNPWRQFAEQKSIAKAQLNSLAYFASVLKNEKIECKTLPSSTELSGNNLYLKDEISLFNSSDLNRLAYKCAVLFSLELSEQGIQASSESLLERKLLLCQNFHRIKDSLFEKYPGFAKDFSDLVTRLGVHEAQGLRNSRKGVRSKTLQAKLDEQLWKLIHGVPTPPLILEKLKSLPQSSDPENPIWDLFALPTLAKKSVKIMEGDPNETPLPSGTEKQGKNKVRVKRVELKDNREEENDLFHSFEKIETVEEFKGIQRNADGEDEMMSHAEALDDLNLDQVTRGSQTSKSLYKAEVECDDDIEFQTSAPQELEIKTQVFLYPEWNYKTKSYLQDWCRVFEEATSPPPAQDAERSPKETKEPKDGHRTQVQLIRKRLLKAALDQRPEKRLRSGRYVDTDAYIAIKSSTPSGVILKDNFYTNLNKKDRDLSIVVLLDLSMSSDAWVNNRRVLDTCLEALEIFGDAVDELGDPILIASFSSNTRKDCRVHILKDFSDTWDSFKAGSGDLVPSGYTRMGPAIRHAEQLLAKQKTRKKLLLILTDGKVTDLDKYEGHYGIKDVRMAIQESKDAGTIPFAIAVDPSSKRFLPDIFSEGHYSILNSSYALADALGSLYAKLSG